MFKKGFIKIYKALRRIKTNEADECSKFSADDYKAFEFSNERSQLRKYFNFDLNMLKCLFDELIVKVNAFVKKSLPNFLPPDRIAFEKYLPIINNTMSEKEKFDPICLASIKEQNLLYF